MTRIGKLRIKKQVNIYIPLRLVRIWHVNLIYELSVAAEPLTEEPIEYYEDGPSRPPTRQPLEAAGSRPPTRQPLETVGSRPATRQAPEGSRPPTRQPQQAVAKGAFNLLTREEERQLELAVSRYSWFKVHTSGMFSSSYRVPTLNEFPFRQP